MRQYCVIYWCQLTVEMTHMVLVYYIPGRASWVTIIASQATSMNSSSTPQLEQPSVTSLTKKWSTERHWSCNGRKTSRWKPKDGRKRRQESNERMRSTTLPQYGNILRLWSKKARNCRPYRSRQSLALALRFRNKYCIWLSNLPVVSLREKVPHSTESGRLCWLTSHCWFSCVCCLKNYQVVLLLDYIHLLRRLKRRWNLHTDFERWTIFSLCLFFLTFVFLYWPCQNYYSAFYTLNSLTCLMTKVHRIRVIALQLDMWIKMTSVFTIVLWQLTLKVMWLRTWI